MKHYVIAIVSAAIICAVGRSLINEKSTAGQLVRLLTGILMSVTLVAPIVNISFENIVSYMDGLAIEADSYITKGTSVAQESIDGIIISQTEAYILDKADRMGVRISVEVELDEDNDSVPCGVTVKGMVSPYAKEVISKYIEDTLGITRENQKWT